MKTVNLGDPLTHRISLRLSDKQFEFLTQVSTIMGITPSDYLRMVVNAGMVSMSKSVDTMFNGMVGMSNENIKTDEHNLV